MPSSTTATPAAAIDVATVRRWLGDGGETAFIDVREEGQHGAGHPLLAVNLPYSRLEIAIGHLVPRHSCRIVLVDDGDGIADKAARRLAVLGYDRVHVITGGIDAWSAEYPLFPSTNVPSKAFAEIVEHEYGTPAISAAELDRRRRAGDKVIVLDSRPLDEYARFHVPGAVACPAPSWYCALPIWCRSPMRWSLSRAPGAPAASSARSRSSPPASPIGSCRSKAGRRRGGSPGLISNRA